MNVPLREATRAHDPGYLQIPKERTFVHMLSTEIVPQGRDTVAIEVIPRIRFAERLALRSAIGLDGLDRAEALTAIASVLSIAEQWAVAS